MNSYRYESITPYAVREQDDVSESQHRFSRNKERANPLTRMLSVSDPNVVRRRARSDQGAKFESDGQLRMALFLKLATI